jgi:hypothetical protein
VEGAVEVLALEGGILVDRVEGVIKDELGPDVKLVIALPPDLGIQSLAKAAPDVQFLAVGIPGLQVSSNLSLIGPEGFRPDQQGFIAGLAAVLSTPDWRVGVITLEGSGTATAAMRGFINGAHYYCGKCIPSRPPYISYPLIYSIQDASVEGEQALDYIFQSGGQVVFMVKEIASVELQLRFGQGDFSLIGVETQQDMTILDKWIATVRPDPITGIESLWEDLMLGQGGFSQAMSFKLSQVDPASISPGRQHLVEEIIQSLVDGVIETGVDPDSGEDR